MTDRIKADAGDLSARVGELRRLTFMYSDIVGSTELSGRLEPEAYRELMRGYREASRDVIENRFDGHIVRIKGDGTLSIFGFPGRARERRGAGGPCGAGAHQGGRGVARRHAGRSDDSLAFVSGSTTGRSTSTSMRPTSTGLLQMSARASKPWPIRARSWSLMR